MIQSWMNLRLVQPQMFRNYLEKIRPPLKEFYCRLTFLVKLIKGVAAAWEVEVEIDLTPQEAGKIAGHNLLICRNLELDVFFR